MSSARTLIPAILLCLAFMLAACGGTAGQATPVVEDPATGATAGPSVVQVTAPISQPTPVSSPPVTAAPPSSPGEPAPATPAPSAPPTKPAASPAEERPANADVPDFKLVAYQGTGVLGGKRTEFSRVFRHGRPVVLNFWAGNCPPCRVEMPYFQELADEYEGRVIFVGVDVGVFTGLGGHGAARQLLEDTGVRYPAGYAVDASPLRQYNVLTMPATVVFAPDGEIVDHYLGLMPEERLREVVGNLLKPDPR